MKGIKSLKLNSQLHCLRPPGLCYYCTCIKLYSAGIPLPSPSPHFASLRLCSIHSPFASIFEAGLFTTISDFHSVSCQCEIHGDGWICYAISSVAGAALSLLLYLLSWKFSAVTLCVQPSYFQWSVCAVCKDRLLLVFVKADRWISCCFWGV